MKQKDPVAISNAINRILSDDKLKNEMVTSSKKIVDEFSIEKLERKYIETIKSVLNFR